MEVIVALLLVLGVNAAPEPFGPEFPKLDSLAVGEWWKAVPPRQNPPPAMNVPRDQVIAFAVYTHDLGVLKLTAQLYPLKPDESRERAWNLSVVAAGLKLLAPP